MSKGEDKDSGISHIVSLLGSELRLEFTDFMMLFIKSSILNDFVSYYYYLFTYLRPIIIIYNTIIIIKISLCLCLGIIDYLKNKLKLWIILGRLVNRHGMLITNINYHNQ